MSNEEFNINDPTVDLFIKESVTDMFNKYRNCELKKMDESEIGVVEICIGFYPNDIIKQEALAYCVIRATMETDSLTFRKVSEEKILPLAIELGVEEAIIQEILNIKARQIIGEENNLSYNWQNVEKAQNKINKDPELTRDQKLDILLYIILSNDEDNWV